GPAGPHFRRPAPPEAGRPARGKPRRTTAASRQPAADVPAHRVAAAQPLYSRCRSRPPPRSQTPGEHSRTARPFPARGRERRLIDATVPGSTVGRDTRWWLLGSGKDQVGLDGLPDVELA